MLSAVPVSSRFLAFLLLNRSIEKLFSSPVEELLDDLRADAGHSAATLTDNALPKAPGHRQTQKVRRENQRPQRVSLKTYNARRRSFLPTPTPLAGGFALAIGYDDAGAACTLPKPGIAAHQAFPHMGAQPVTITRVFAHEGRRHWIRSI